MNILFFGICYHGYTQAIINEISLIGANVTFVDIQPRSLGYKTMRTLSRPTFERLARRRLELAVEEARSKVYDKVIFLQAHQMPIDVLDRLRSTQPTAEFTLYNWDSLNTHDYRQHATFFDRVLTFDRHDAEVNAYGYLPLFCIRRWQELARNRAEPRSIYMIGNIVRIERYNAIEAFRSFCVSNELFFREHLKISPVVFGQALRQGVLPRGVSFRSIPEPEFANMIEISNAVFDFANHSQSGQTMRMMESLCSGKKIITNSQWVKNEPFYSSDRIHVFSGNDYSGVLDFLATPISQPDERFSEYFIQSFTRKFIGLEPVSNPRGCQ